MSRVFDSFKKSLAWLDEVLREKKNMISRDAAIQRFEFTVELAWKSLQHFLRDQKVVCHSPKECLQESFKFGLVQDNPLWLKMIDDRNLTAHTYNEEVAEEIYNRLSGYLILLGSLKESLQKFIQ